MKRLVILLSVGAAFVLFASCKEKVVHKYKEDPELFIVMASRDSMSYSFYLKETQLLQDTIWLQVNLVGMLSPKDRSLPLRVVTTGEDDAVAGKHYIPLDDPKISNWFFMPANDRFVKVPIILLRDASLKQKEYRLKVELFDNGEFGANLDNQNQYLIKFSDIGSKPDLWDSYWLGYFGQWGQVKMRFIIDYVGFSDFDTFYDNDTRQYLKMKANEKLEQYLSKNPPLYEDDETTIVEFPK